MKSLIKQRVPVGLRRALHHLRSEWRIAKAHRRGLRAAKQYRNSKAIKINIGCGPNPKPGWLNLDIEGADLHARDMRKSIPLPDKCAEMIYSEHFFEHLDYPGDAMRFLRECRRLLSPGGIFSVGVAIRMAFTGLREIERLFAARQTFASWLVFNKNGAHQLSFQTGR